uniref:Uncharacterized protein n=1 Tax=Schizaphis graminum TaxID=13262 RepID=A0A2S2PQC9_SCHGA
MSAFVRRGTGGGPPTSLVLNGVEENALQLIKPVSISGHTLSAESIAEFSFEPAFVREKVNCNTNKRTSSAARLDEGNLIGDRLADLGERKLLAKQKYWDQKLSLLAEQNNYLKSIRDCLLANHNNEKSNNNFMFIYFQFIYQY